MLSPNKKATALAVAIFMVLLSGDFFNLAFDAPATPEAEDGDIDQCAKYASKEI